MSTYYINAGSSIEDGLTPETGYNNLTRLLANIILDNNDIVELVDNGVVNDSSNSASVISSTVTLQSWFGNVNKPTWKPAREVDIIGASSFNMYDLLIVGTATFVINGTINVSMTPTCTNIDIERCNFSSDATISAYGLVSARIVNNIFRNMSIPAIGLDNYSGDIIPDINGIAINNNTFYNNNSYCVGLWAMGSVTNVRVLNNLFISAAGRLYWLTTGSTTNVLIDYNIDFPTPEGIYQANANLFGSHDGEVDPKLVDPNNNNFILQSISICIDTGVGNDQEPSVPTNDYFGTTRPQGAGTDRGACEYIFIIPPVPPTPPVPEESFYTEYRLQDEDLNVTFCAQGIAYPAGLTYSYNPYSVTYEIDYLDPNNDYEPVPVGYRYRTPLNLKTGTYRANFVVDNRWSPGFYQIVWNYTISKDAPIQTQSEIFEIINEGVHYIPFEIYFCKNDLEATFVVLQDLLDLPASFVIIS